MILLVEEMGCVAMRSSRDEARDSSPYVVFKVGGEEFPLKSGSVVSFVVSEALLDAGIEFLAHGYGFANAAALQGVIQGHKRVLRCHFNSRVF